MDSLNAALQFLGEIKGGIVLQYDRREQVPFIIRRVKSILGEPNRRVGDKFFYPEGYVALVKVDVEHHMRGYRRDQLFYIENSDI